MRPTWNFQGDLESLLTPLLLVAFLLLVVGPGAPSSVLAQERLVASCW